MKSLVIIDDEMIVIKGIQAILSRIRDDIEVVGWATDGIAGYDVLIEARPDIAVVDIRIPLTDGLSLIESVLTALPDTVFLIVSGYEEFAYAQKALKLGVADYLSKPITIPKLKAALERADACLERSAQGFSQKISRFTTEAELAILGGEKQRLTACLHEMMATFTGEFLPASAAHGLYQALLGLMADVLGGRAVHLFGRYIDSPTKNTRPISPHEAEAYLLEWLESIFDEVHRVAATDITDALQKAIAYIDAHYHQPLSLTEVSRMAGINSTYLSARFKEIAGKNFINYLTEKRVARAKELLSLGLTGLAVCAQVGYTNYRYFCHLFRKSTGLTPMEYRKKIASTRPRAPETREE